MYTVVFRRLHDGVPFVMTRVHLPEPVARTVLGSPELAAGAVSTSTIIGLTEHRLGDLDSRSGTVDYRVTSR